MANNYCRRIQRRGTERQVNRIDILPDDALLEIFDFYMKTKSSRYSRLYNSDKEETEKWKSLVHVCLRWRNVVFGSPRRLNLELFCTPETPAKDTLDVWPALPLIVEGDMTSSGTDNVIAALGQSNRVREVFLDYVAGRQLEEVLAAMQVPFPKLDGLRLTSNGETMPVIPDSFLDGSAPLLEFVELSGILFPALPKLLFSATHLVDLGLTNIPHSGYISPEAIVALISVLSSLEKLNLGFRSPQSRPDPETRRPLPSKRSVIPALDKLHFKGVIEYLEDLVTLIDTPQLSSVIITFFNQIDFDTPRLARFINRAPRLGKRGAHVEFDDDFVHVSIIPGYLSMYISCKEPDWQLSSIEQVCNSSLHPLSTVEDLRIKHRYRKLVWKGDSIENTLWLQLLLPFTAVKDIYLHNDFAPGIAAALQELDGDRITEMLPSLQNIFVQGLEPSGPFREKIGQFVAARQLSNHPVAISDWNPDNPD